MSFKYAHLADLHLGSWREEKMRDLSTKAFLMALDKCVADQVDFILFTGDLFNTSLPALDTLKLVTKRLKELKDRGIALYTIAGSHDFSPSGKTMIDVLENAGLLKNVCKGSVNPETKELELRFTVDEKTGTKMTGILGRRGMLDRLYYENLHRDSLEGEEGYKIFLFHTTIGELLPKHLDLMDSQPLSFLPRGFNYYAGGHIHHPTKKEFPPDYPVVTYAGALFPSNFAEVERYGHGGYYLISVDFERGDSSSNSHGNSITGDSGIGSIKQNVAWVPLEVIKHRSYELNCNNKAPEIVTYEIMDAFENEKLDNTLVTLRLYGILSRGHVSDVNFKEIFDRLYNRGAYFVMKNTVKLESQTFEEIKSAISNPENLEEETIKEHLGQVKLFEIGLELDLTKSLLQALATSKREGETATDYQRRIESDMNRLLEIDFN